MSSLPVWSDHNNIIVDIKVNPVNTIIIKNSLPYATMTVLP